VLRYCTMEMRSFFTLTSKRLSSGAEAPILLGAYARFEACACYKVRCWARIE
jgi:hypothetical protein